jgi:hypothetical protein
VEFKTGAVIHNIWYQNYRKRSDFLRFQSSNVQKKWSEKNSDVFHVPVKEDYVGEDKTLLGFELKSTEF